LLFVQKTSNLVADFNSNGDMYSATQLKSIKLKLQGKYFDKQNDQEVIIERLNSNFYVTVNRGLLPGSNQKDIALSGAV